MDIANVLDPRRELDLTEFTGSSTAGPSGQQPQIAPFYGRLFDQEVVRRRQPETYEVHGMETAGRKEDAETQAEHGKTLAVADMKRKAKKSQGIRSGGASATSRDW
jgi:hypothetical protein